MKLQPMEWAYLRLQGWLAILCHCVTYTVNLPEKIAVTAGKLLVALPVPVAVGAAGVGTSQLADTSVSEATGNLKLRVGVAAAA